MAEVFAAALVVGQDAADGLPVVAAVAAVAQVDQLVDHDVVDQPHGGLDDAPVQADGAGAVAAPPPLPLIGDDDARQLDAGLRAPGRHPFRQPRGRVPAKPGDQCGAQRGGAGLPRILGDSGARDRARFRR